MKRRDEIMQCAEWYAMNYGRKMHYEARANLIAAIDAAFASLARPATADENAAAPQEAARPNEQETS